MGDDDYSAGTGDFEDDSDDNEDNAADYGDFDVNIENDDRGGGHMAISVSTPRMMIVVVVMKTFLSFASQDRSWMLFSKRRQLETSSCRSTLS